MSTAKKICDIEALFHPAEASSPGPMLKGVVADPGRTGEGRLPADCSEIIFTGRYDYHPNIPFNRLENFPEGDLKLGVELESIAKSRQDLFAIRKFKSNCVYLQRDGSLPDAEGYELTTIPLPATWAVRAEFWKRLLKNYKNLSKLSDRACGLHVHVDRGFFGSTNAMIAERLAYVCYLYSFCIPQDHPGLLKKIFGRDSNDYCSEYRNPHLSTYKSIGLESLSMLAFRRRSPSDFASAGGRHAEISVTDRTFEFRRGQGTFDYASIARIIQFIHSLALFSKFVTGPRQVTLEGYKAFVRKFLVSHEELIATLEGASS